MHGQSWQAAVCGGEGEGRSGNRPRCLTGPPPPQVCEEYQPEEGLETYELVAHLPDKSNNYLSPALATLQKNT